MLCQYLICLTPTSTSNAVGTLTRGMRPEPALSLKAGMGPHVALGGTQVPAGGAAFLCPWPQDGLRGEPGNLQGGGGSGRLLGQLWAGGPPVVPWRPPGAKAVQGGKAFLSSRSLTCLVTSYRRWLNVMLQAPEPGTRALARWRGWDASQREEGRTGRAWPHTASGPALSWAPVRDSRAG